MRLLVFGSRNLTARHLPIIRGYLSLDRLIQEEWWQVDEALLLIHGDGPPGKTPGAIGADKLSEVAAALEWPDTRRGRRFPPDVGPDATREEWAQAAARRNAAMVAAKPDRVLCFHENLDMSKGSAITADLLTRASIPFRYVRVSGAGEVVSVEDR